MVDKIKLTKRQNDILWKLQNGWVFITGKDFGAILTKGYEQENIRLDVFYALVDKGLLVKEMKHWNFEITQLGKITKTNRPKLL